VPPTEHPRTDWTRAEIAALFDLPFTELLFQAASVTAAPAISNARHISPSQFVPGARITSALVMRQA